MSKVAFILAGGASRGAYQAGCLKRLDEEGIVPDLVIGSSIGVCNSLVYATSGAEGLWGFWSRAVSLPQVFDISLRRNALTSNAFFSMDRLTRFVEQEVDFDRCFESETELTYILTNLSAGHEELRGNRTERDVERFKTVSRIGYAIPILHPLIELDGDLYADGGFLWNVPFEYAEEWGATDIFVLSVVPSKLPRADSLRFIPQVAMRMYDIFWRTIGNTSILEKKLEDGKYHGINVTVLEPSPETGMFDPFGMLNAYPRKSRKLLWDGYRDTEKLLREGITRDGREKGKVPESPASSDGAGQGRGSGGRRRPRETRR
jgi:predicted acylesterase/phospholipase RssA